MLLSGTARRNADRCRSRSICRPPYPQGNDHCMFLLTICKMCVKRKGLLTIVGSVGVVLYIYICINKINHFLQCNYIYIYCMWHRVNVLYYNIYNYN